MSRQIKEPNRFSIIIYQWNKPLENGQHFTLWNSEPQHCQTHIPSKIAPRHLGWAKRAAFRLLYFTVQQWRKQYVQLCQNRLTTKAENGNNLKFSSVKLPQRASPLVNETTTKIGKGKTGSILPFFTLQNWEDKLCKSRVTTKAHGNNPNVSRIKLPQCALFWTKNLKKCRVGKMGRISTFFTVQRLGKTNFARIQPQRLKVDRKKHFSAIELPQRALFLSKTHQNLGWAKRATLHPPLLSIHLESKVARIELPQRGRWK